MTAWVADVQAAMARNFSADRKFRITVCVQGAGPERRRQSKLLWLIYDDMANATTNFSLQGSA